MKYYITDLKIQKKYQRRKTCLPCSSWRPASSAASSDASVKQKTVQMIDLGAPGSCPLSKQQPLPNFLLSSNVTRSLQQPNTNHLQIFFHSVQKYLFFTVQCCKYPKFKSIYSNFRLIPEQHHFIGENVWNNGFCLAPLPPPPELKALHQRFYI